MTVFVGVDGSAHAEQALRWAASQARARGETLSPVYVYTSASLYYPPEVLALQSAVKLAESTKRAANEELDRALANVHDDLEGVGVVPKTLEDPQPAQALCELASPDDMIVVGSRGRGGFRGLLLGSVSQQVVQYAPCPVTVVPSVAARG